MFTLFLVDLLKKVNNNLKTIQFYVNWFKKIFLFIIWFMIFLPTH